MTAKPFLKWVGGKTKLVPELVGMFPKKFNNYYEPFVGGGALFYEVVQKYKVD
jgi:DNA adenine methylase